MESIIFFTNHAQHANSTCVQRGKQYAPSTFDWPALRASTCCLISWWIAPEQPKTAASAATIGVVVVATSAVGWLVGCGRVDEEQEQEEEEEEDVASGSGGSRERRRRRRRATIPDGVGKYINEIHGREGEAKRGLLRNPSWMNVHRGIIIVLLWERQLRCLSCV